MSLLLTSDRIKEHLSDSGIKLANITASMAYDNPLLLKSLLEVSLEDKNPWSQRASHVIAIIACNYPELVSSYIPLIIKNLGEMKTEGVKRNFMKIMKVTSYKFTSKEESIILNLCFDYLNMDNSIAVKAYCMDILYNLTLKYPELQSELYHTIESLIQEASPGLKSKGIKTMNKIIKPGKN